MKKLIAIILALVCIVALTGCQPADNDTPKNTTPADGTVSFVAKVLELHSGSYLVRPVKGSSELNSADKISVPMQEGIDPQVGDYIKITYDGLIMESYPAQIGNATIEMYTEEICDLPPLATVPNYTQEQFAAEMEGVTEDQVHAAWGNPDGMFSGFYGDIYYTDDTQTMQVLVYYDWETKIVEHAAYRPSMFQYQYEGEGCGGDFIITLYSDGTFQYYEGMLSSYIGMGTWTVDENNITCLKDDVTHTIDGSEFVRTNYFYSVGNEMQWIEEGSDNFLYVKVKDGEKFTSIYSGPQPSEE